jgi:hypothetical protein
MISWLSKTKNQTALHEIEVNIRGLFDNKFLKESFILNFSREILLEEVLQLIDKKLKTNLFSKFNGEFPANWMVLINGDRLDLPMDKATLIKSKDQLSIISALSGG